MPIGLGACTVENAVQKCPVEDRRRQRMIVFQKARDFRQVVAITPVPAVRMRGNQFCCQIKSWPIKEKLQRRFGLPPFQRKSMGAVFRLYTFDPRSRAIWGSMNLPSATWWKRAT